MMAAESIEFVNSEEFLWRVVVVWNGRRSHFGSVEYNPYSEEWTVYHGLANDESEVASFSGIESGAKAFGFAEGWFLGWFEARDTFKV